MPKTHDVTNSPHAKEEKSKKKGTGSKPSADTPTPSLAAPQLNGEIAFTAHDFSHLMENEHARYAVNSKKIGHAVMLESGHTKTALQFPTPVVTEDGAPVVRPLINFEEIEPFHGMQRYRAETPDGKTPMFARRLIQGEVGNLEHNDNIEIACFSPSEKKGQLPFFGSIKPTAIFREDLPKGVKKDLDKELAEIGQTFKSGSELPIHHPSVPERDLIKTRTPDQNTVMGESARDAYENFFGKLTDELHPEMKKRLHRAFTADIKGGLFVNNHRPEWLHAYGWSLMPMDKNPQTKDNLGAGPKWANTQMMVLERIVKWFALKSPESLLSIKPKFEMLLDSDLIKHIDFEVKVQIKDTYVKLMQKIDPHLAWPMFPKSSDLAQGAAITHAMVTGVEPVSQHSVKQIRTKPSQASNAAGPAMTTRSSTSASADKKTSDKPMPQRAAAEALTTKTPHAVLAAPAPAAASSPAPSANQSVDVAAKKTKARSKARAFPTQQKQEKSVVQIYSNSVEADYDTPWKGSDEQNCTGSGVIIGHMGKKYILTNAHVAENAIYLQVRMANDRKKKYEAKRVCVAYQCDLALLEVDDPEFNLLAEPATIGTMVDLQQKVMSVGFPMGGTEISVSKGIVSRIQVDTYSVSGLDMLQVQIDAAVNPGNSGGPVFSNNKVVGIAFQGYGLHGLGYMIPTPIIGHFLTEVFSGNGYRGFPVIPFISEELENAHEREYYNLADRTGVRVVKVDNLCDAFAKLKTDDILLSIDGMQISNQGTIDIDKIGNCINLIHATQSKFMGDVVHFRVLRKNQETQQAEELDIDILLDCVPGDSEKVSIEERDKMPTYFINSGLCFMPLTRNYLGGEGGIFEEMQLLEEGCSLADAPKKNKDEQYVVMSHILACKDTQGYDKHVNEIVREVNGKLINNIRDVVAAMEGNQQPKHVITFSSKSKVIVPNMTPAQLQHLLKRNRITAPCSEDLMSHLAGGVVGQAVDPNMAPMDTTVSSSKIDDPNPPTAEDPNPSKIDTPEHARQRIKRAISSDDEAGPAEVTQSKKPEKRARMEPLSPSLLEDTSTKPSKQGRGHPVAAEAEEDVVDTAAMFKGGMMPGIMKYKGFLDQMEAHYKSQPQDDDDDDDDDDEDDFEGDSDSCEDSEAESNDTEIDVETELEEQEATAAASAVPPTTLPSHPRLQGQSAIQRPGFFSSALKSSQEEESTEEAAKQWRFSKK